MSIRQEFEKKKFAVNEIIYFVDNIVDDLENIKNLVKNNPDFFSSGKTGKPILKTVFEKLETLIEEKGE